MFTDNPRLSRKETYSNKRRIKKKKSNDKLDLNFFISNITKIGIVLIALGYFYEFVCSSLFK